MLDLLESLRFMRGRYKLALEKARASWAAKLPEGQAAIKRLENDLAKVNKRIIEVETENER